MRSGSDSIATDWLIKRFNERFFNEDLDTSQPDPFHLRLDKSTRIDYEIFDDVVKFCLSTEVYKLLGLNPIDILTNFDMPMYDRLKELVIEHAEERHKSFDKAKAEMEKRQQDLLKGK